MKTNRPSVSVSYLCHSKSSPNSRSEGQLTYPIEKMFIIVFMLPFYFKLDRTWSIGRRK